MAKKKRSTNPVLSWKPPTPAERVRMAARDVAQAAIEANPNVQKMKDQIESAVVKAAKRVENPGRTKKLGRVPGSY